MRLSSVGDAKGDWLAWWRVAVPGLVWLLLLVAPAEGLEPGESQERQSTSGPNKSVVRESRGNRGSGRADASAAPRDRDRPLEGLKNRSDPSRVVELATAREEQISETATASDPVDDPSDDWMSLAESVPVAPSVLAVLVLSVVPSVLLMTTCFARFSIVLTLVRQALGTQQLPPNSVLLALALFLSCLVMEPVWRRAYLEGMRPYLQPQSAEEKPDLETATLATLKPLREFMSSQIELAGNSDTVWVLLESRSTENATVRDSGRDLTYEEVPLPTLAAAFVLSELKVGFVIGFQILLPFLVIDLIVGLVLSMLGLTAISHGSVSLPFKLLLFVLVDGWTVIVGRLLASVAGG